MPRSYKLISFSVILLSFSFIVPSLAFADDDTVIDHVNITVPSSCTMAIGTGTGENVAHTASMDPGEYKNNIGLTTLRTVCNDINGFAIYAIGYSNDEYGNTELITSNANPGASGTATGNIITGTAQNGNTSNWAMQVTKVTNSSTSYIPNNMTIANSFDSNSYHVVPSIYTKVANYTSATDMGANALGAKIQTRYAVYVTQVQAPGTYTGQVLYTLVHPSNSASTICSPSGTTISTIGCMQDITSTNKSTVLASMTTNRQYQLMDSRDYKFYYVAKLADGNIWMTQNLDLDIIGGKTYTPSDTDLLANWTAPYSTTKSIAEWTTVGDPYDDPISYDPGDLCWGGNISSSSNNDGLSGHTTTCTDRHYHLGNYYSWNAAIATSNWNVTLDGADINHSICPAGWRLPTSTGNSSYMNLVNTLGLTSGQSGNIQQSPIFFTYSGGITYPGFNLGNIDYVGSYWVSYYGTGQNADPNEFYYSSSGTLQVVHGDMSDDGKPVRCIVR